jgi:AcrR family transcriptional regulator
VNTTTRTYRQTSRAAAAEATRERIVEVAMKRFMDDWYDEVTLRVIASDAGVALQTVVNHFGTKEGVLEAAIERLNTTIRNARFGVTPDDLDGAISALVGDYERTGPGNLRAIAVAHRVPTFARALQRGRAAHLEWVELAFPTLIAAGTHRQTRIAQIATVTDVESWNLLRRDHGLTRKQTETAIKELLQGLGS